MKPLTLCQIRNTLPTHIMLTLNDIVENEDLISGRRGFVVGRRGKIIFCMWNPQPLSGTYVLYGLGPDGVVQHRRYSVPGDAEIRIVDSCYNSEIKGVFTTNGY